MKKLHGYSLIELMIAMVVGLIVLNGAIGVVIDGQQRAREDREINLLQDTARFALHALTQDLYMAGYWGCATRDTADIANSVRTSAGGFINMTPITGYEGGESTIHFPVDMQARAVKGSDAFIVRHSASDKQYMVERHVAGNSANIKLWEKHHFSVGDTLVIAAANCRQIGIFQMSGPNNKASNEIVHNTNQGNGNASDNCTKALKGNFECSSLCVGGKCPNSSDAEYENGDKVMKFVANAYYVGQSPVYAGTDLEHLPILYRQELSSEGVLATRAVELASGVELLNMTYGVDRTGNGEVDQFISASEMDLDSSGFVTSDEWEKVTAVRVQLILRSIDPVYPSNQNVIVDGREYADRYLRQGFTQTVQLRNHG